MKKLSKLGKVSPVPSPNVLLVGDFDVQDPDDKTFDENSAFGFIGTQIRSYVADLDAKTRIVRLVAGTNVIDFVRSVFPEAISRTEGRLQDFGAIARPEDILGSSAIGRAFVLCSPEEFPPVLEATIEIGWSNDDLIRIAGRRFGQAPKPMAREIYAGSADLILRTARSIEQFNDLASQYVRFWDNADNNGEEDQQKLSRRGTTTADRAAFSGQHVELHRPTGPLVSQLHGYGEAACWALDLSADIEAYRTGKIQWSEVDRGCVLYGPPGTGKSQFATALAAECAVPVIYTSYAAWSSVGEGHLSYVTKAIRATFTVAAENAPCIIFIDELDTIVGRGKGHSQRDDWWTTITTTLLEQTDGALRTEGVVVVGATNHIDSVDTAMLRSGRLDRSFQIGLPDEMALLGILQMHFAEEAIAADEIQLVATALAGTVSGADVARLARECRRIARKNARPVDAALVISQALPAETRSPGIVRRIAIHEAGHAVLGWLAGDTVHAASIVSQSGVGGYVRREAAEFDQTAAGLDKLVIPLLGGRAAELVILGDSSTGAASDLASASRVIASGESGGLGSWLSSGDVDRHVIERRLRRLEAEATLLVTRHRRVIEALADRLIAKRVLSRAAIEDLLAKVQPSKSRDLEQ
ncbi:AAA family ATPase [Jiella mangrovi]|uniref:AAA family ATPase n=1 Tax=Jiella mangrovi TaxID=2821407 RepID=A0ABS4BLI7_9HYPH|nr:AAA family ATPase [Jiella mangrovi]MBP0617576.1 AAA family ATPase [Jiella mangrovi]